MGNKQRVGSRRKCYRKKTVKATSSKEPLPSTSSPEQIRPRPTSTDSHKDSLAVSLKLRETLIIMKIILNHWNMT